MNYFDQLNVKTDQPRALAIVADQSNIVNAAQYNLWMAIAMFLVRAFNRINPFTAQTTNRSRKLKLQLLTIYAVPSLFFFGASGILLMVMYLCIFELVLLAVAPLTA